MYSTEGTFAHQGEALLARRPAQRGRVGVFGVAHGVYFRQFDGLREKLQGYYEEFLGLVGQEEVEVLDYGMVDSVENGREALEKMRRDDPDILLCDMVTYATSSVFDPIIRGMRVPVILVALQPLAGLDYGSASTRMQLENDNICAVPEFTCAANRLGHKVLDVILGTLYGDPLARAALHEWCVVAGVLRALKGARIGLMGHVLESMYDMHVDITSISSAFGVYVPLLEVEEVVELAQDAGQKAICEKRETIERLFSQPEPGSDPIARRLTEEDLNQAARTAVALDRLVERERLTGLAYYYEGQAESLVRRTVGSFIVGNSLLIAQGIPMCGEYDLKTCIAMLIMDRMGIGGSFAELHPFDFREDFILVGHDGPHHIAIAEGKPVLRSLTSYHGKPGSGASVEFKIREGPITLLGITQDAGGQYRMIVAEGESRHGAIPPTGNTNTRAFFLPDTRTFVRAWVMACPTHHFALGVGHHAATLKKIGDALGIETAIVRP